MNCFCENTPIRRATLIHLFSLSQANHKKVLHYSSIFLALQSYVDPPLTQTVTVWSYPRQRDTKKKVSAQIILPSYQSGP